MPSIFGTGILIILGTLALIFKLRRGMRAKKLLFRLRLSILVVRGPQLNGGPMIYSVYPRFAIGSTNHPPESL